MGDSVGNQHSSVEHDDTDAAVHPLPGSNSYTAHWHDNNGDMWVFGGEGYDNEPSETPHLLDQLWKFNSETESWFQATNGSAQIHVTGGSKHAPTPRKGAVMCGLTDYILVLFGGEDQHRHRLSDTWIFNMDQRSWLLLPKPVVNVTLQYPKGRSKAAYWCLHDRMIVYAGKGQTGMLDDIWEFSLQDLKWRPLVQHIQTDTIDAPIGPFPAARHSPSTWVISTDLYMFGGSVSSTVFDIQEVFLQKDVLSDFWYFETINQTWNLLSARSVSINQPEPRHSSCSFVTSGFLWMFGGEAVKQVESSSLTVPTLLSDLWVYSLHNQNWTFIVNHTHYTNHSQYIQPQQELIHGEPVTGRKGAVMWQTNHVTYLFGGYGFDGRKKVAYLNDHWVLLTGDYTKYLTKKLYFEKQLWLANITGGKLLLFIFSGFGTVVLFVGLVCFMKKMISRPNNAPRKEYNVKYSRLNSEATLEM